MKSWIRIYSVNLFLLSLVILTGCNDNYTQPTPEVTSINPVSGLPSTVVSITGKDFIPLIDQNSVSFNGVNAIVLSATPGQLNVIVPGGATTGPITVTSGGLTATNKPNFTIEHPDVIVRQVSPNKGGYNTIVKISGENFYSTATDNIVTVNGIPSTVDAATATELIVRIPLRAGTGDVVVNGEIAAQKFTYTPDIFVCGYEEGSIAGQYFGKVWKNGIGTFVSPGVQSYPYDMAVVGDDVYLVGIRGIIPSMWKNNVATPLVSDLATRPYFILVNNNDVYCGGYATDKLGFNYCISWKNGVAEPASPATKLVTVGAMEFFNNSLYFGVSEFHPSIGQAAYYKNKVPSFLSSKASTVNDMVHDGDDFYLIGWNVNAVGNAIATLWKNGVETSLVPDSYRSSASEIKIYNGNVYIAGYVTDASNSNTVFLWKNGNVTIYAKSGGSANPVSMDIIGDDVYVLGFEEIGAKTIATYWKNGTQLYLNNGQSAIPKKLILR